MHNFDKVFQVFSKHYQPTPLEVFTEPYQVLISTILSARARDETTLAVSTKLFFTAPSIRDLMSIEKKKIEKIIKPLGFYKAKSNNIIKSAEIVMNKFDGKVPNTQKKLMELPGVGIKTANLVLNRVFNKPAISVDTHVHRISNLLGWVKTNTPEQTEKELSKILPKKYWTRTNKLFVSIGRQYPTNSRLARFLKDEGLISAKSTYLV